MLSSALFSTLLRAVFATLALTLSASALPPQALYVDGTAPGSDKNPSVHVLPGFSSLPRNVTLGHGGRVKDDTPFGDLCRQVTLGGHGKVGETTIEGKCYDEGQGLWWDTSLNLNHCIGNGGGYLVYQEDGNFDNTCRPCTLNDVDESDDLMLKCNCLDTRGIPRYTQLQLGFDVPHALAVKPVNGRFLCGKTEGIQQPSFWR